MSDIITSISSSTTRGSSEEDARLKWNLLEPLTIIKGHISPINAACLYADAKLLVSGYKHPYFDLTFIGTYMENY